MRFGSESINRATRGLIGILGTIALLLSCWQMAERYLFPQIGSVWVEEIVVYLIAWATFLGTAALVYDDQHVRGDAIIHLLPLRVQRILEIMNSAMGFAFCGIVAWFGYLIALDAFTVDERSVTGSAFPIWLFYVSLPVGMALAVVWYVRRVFLLTFRFDPTKFSVQSGQEA